MSLERPSLEKNTPRPKHNAAQEQGKFTKPAGFGGFELRVEDLGLRVEGLD